MGAFAAGDVVLPPFPFSDLSGSKLRPALLLADVGRGDWLACQITSNPYGDRRASYVRPGKLFTANESLMSQPHGALVVSTLEEIRAAVVAMLTRPPDGTPTPR